MEMGWGREWDRVLGLEIDQKWAEEWDLEMAPGLDWLWEIV